MTHSLSQSSPPNAPPSPNHEFTTLISALQEATQALISYSQACENLHAKQAQAKQAFDAQKPSTSIPSRSKRTKRREKCQTFAFNRHAPDALNDFADKELAKSFEEAYVNGNFRDEIRYYYVPSYLVKYEHRLLHCHQQNSVLDMLLAVHTDLDIKNKLLTYIANDICEEDILLRQVNESLLLPLRLLQTIHNHLNNFKLIHKTMLPHTQKR